MAKAQCATCLDLKATLKCKCCEVAQCKKCAQFLEEERLKYFGKAIPSHLSGGGVFCNNCFDSKVAPTLGDYDSLMNKAKEVFVFFIEESKETRLIRRSEKTFKVDGDDKDDIVMHLAFLAAQAGFNAVVDISVNAAKHREGSYKITSWSGSGTAAQVDAARHNR